MMQRILRGLLGTGAVVVALATTAPAGAQAGPAHGFRGPPAAEKRLALLAERLELSDEQTRQLLPVLQDAEAEREALHRQALEQLRPEICALMAEVEADIEAVLTPKQIEAFERLREQHRARLGDRRGPGWPRPDCPDATG